MRTLQHSESLKMYILCKITSLFLLATLVSGGQPYNASQMCCDGVVHDYSSEDYNSCCGKELHSYSRQNDENAVVPMCCDKVLHKNPENNSLLCCGTELYNVQTSICYNYSEIVIIPPENRDNNETEACGKSKNDLTFYNPNEQFCCSGKLQEKKENFSCCGEISYNWLTSLCCQDKIIDVGNATNKECCGESYYDYTEARCCYDDIKLEDGKYESVGIVIYSKDKLTTTYGSNCCGHAVYNYMEEICCPDGPKAMPNQSESYICCGTGVIPWPQLCVDGKGVDRTEDDQAVCGDSDVYRTSEEVCYKNTLIKHGENEIICDGNGKLYDKTAQICYEDSIINLTKEEMEENKVYYCEEYIAKN